MKTTRMQLLTMRDEEIVIRVRRGESVPSVAASLGHDLGDVIGALMKARRLCIPIVPPHQYTATVNSGTPGRNRH